MPRLTVRYIIDIEPKLYEQAVALARQEGFDYEDAEPRETLTRSLIMEGINGTFPEGRCDQNGFKLVRATLS